MGPRGESSEPSEMCSQGGYGSPAPSMRWFCLTMSSVPRDLATGQSRIKRSRTAISHAVSQTFPLSKATLRTFATVRAD